MQRGAARRARAQTGQPRQQLDQALDFGSATAVGIKSDSSPAAAAAAGLHFFLHDHFGLAAGVGMRGDQEVLEHFLVVGFFSES